jgi:hypothetical protein
MASNEGVIMNDKLERMSKEVVVALFQGTLLAFSWRDQRKPQKPSVNIPGLRAGIWMRQLPNTSQEF